jgi:hypothetical protein
LVLERVIQDEVAGHAGAGYDDERRHERSPDYGTWWVKAATMKSTPRSSHAAATAFRPVGEAGVSLPTPGTGRRSTLSAPARSAEGPGRADTQPFTPKSTKPAPTTATTAPSTAPS